MRAKQLIVTMLMAAFLFGRPAAVDAGWAGMLVQVTAMLSQIRSYVSTAEAYVAQAQAEMRGLLDPGGLVSSVGSLADWRSLLSELTDLGPLWQPFTESRALVDDAARNYQAVRGVGSHDFGTVGGFLDFLDSQPIGWSAGRESAWQALVDNLGVPAALRDEIREAERLRGRVVNLRYAATADTRLAAAAVLGDHVAGEYVGRGMLDDGVRLLDAARRLTGGPSDPDPALSQAEFDGVSTQLASLRATHSAGALGLRASQLAADAQSTRLDAHREAATAQRVFDRLAHLASAAPPPMQDEVGDEPMASLASGGFMGAWVR